MTQIAGELNKYGQTSLSSAGLRELLFRGSPISNVLVSEDSDIRLYKQYQKELLSSTVEFKAVDESMGVDEFHELATNTWLIPKSYQTLQVLEWLHGKCTTQEQFARVEHEFGLFQANGLVMLLRTLIYLVDKMREEQILWGVGRGSSVNSYILYLIGVHRVDSLKYGLSIEDYLKEK